MKTVWIVLSIILVAIPAWYILYYIWRLIYKAISWVKQKVDNVKAMDTMRKDILRQKAEETKSEPLNELENKVEAKIDIEEDLSDKKKKELSKIIYESDSLKKEWKLEEYEKKLIEWLSINPNNMELNKNLAEYYFTTGVYKKSLPLFKKVIEINPEDHSAIWHLGQIYLIWKDYDMAIVLIEKAINISNDSPKYLISMVEILYNTDKKLEAIWIMEKVIKLRPSNTNYMIALAELYEELKDEDNARKYYFRVLENEPNNELAKLKIQS